MTPLPPTPLPPDLQGLPAGLSPDVVEALAARSVRRDSVPSFQALLAAVLEAVRSTEGAAEQAEGAALSLRQRETVAGVRADLVEIAKALEAGVSAEGRFLTPSRSPADVVRAALHVGPGWFPRLRDRAATETPPAPTWLAAAGAAAQAIGQTADHVATLAAAQPHASSARVLGGRVSDALRADRDVILADIARLVD